MTQTHNNITIKGLEQLFRNVGTFCHRVIHIDVEIIVSEHSPLSAATASKEMHTNTILMKKIRLVIGDRTRRNARIEQTIIYILYRDQIEDNKES